MLYGRWRTRHITIFCHFPQHSVASPLTCQMAPICLPRVQLVYSLCEYDLWSPDRASQHNILSHSLSPQSSNKFPFTKHTLLFLFQDFQSFSKYWDVVSFMLEPNIKWRGLTSKYVCVFSGLEWSQVWKAGDGGLGILSPLSVEVNTKSECANNLHNELERFFSVDISTLCQNVQSGSGAQSPGLLLYLQSSKVNGTKYQVSCKVV